MTRYDPQKEAIQTINTNLAVSAGAGTGKTKVLTERYVYILEHGDLNPGNEVESIVAITFTKKATQEMVERIRSEVRNNFHKGENWKRYYRDLEKSNISTIHSFCGKILRENPIEAKIDPYFEVLDENLSWELLHRAVTEVLTHQLEDNDNVYNLMRILMKNRIEDLTSDFITVYNLIRTVGLTFREVKEITLGYINSLEVSSEDIEEIQSILLYLMDKLPKNSNIYKLKSEPIWEEFLEGKYEKDIYSYIEYFQTKIGTSKKEQEHINRLKELINNVLITKEKDYLWMYESILDILILIDEKYSYKKSEMGGLDYDDLQILVLDLLDNHKVREKYQKKFKYFMIDEFQDTNELQKNIFYKLASSKDTLDRSNLFVVGDPKQSIYGFRGADINVFYNTIEEIKTLHNKDPITLSTNYRTVDTVLHFINDIFMNLMEESYDSLEAHKVSENMIDIEILSNEDLEIKADISPSEQNAHYEADMIAKRIKSLVTSEGYSYKDFAILFRATTRNYIYEEALRNYNIPYFNSSSKRYFHRQEVLDLINGLKVISNPYDTIATIGFLRGPMIGLSDETIYLLIRRKEETLYNTLGIYLDKLNINKDENNKIKLALDLLNYFYSIKDIYYISYLTEQLIRKTYFLETLLLQREGKQSIANIYKFVEIIKDFEKNNKASLEDFIDYIEKNKDNDESEGIIESEGDDVVQLLTIHKSKGLQFPVVIIPEMSRRIVSNFSSILFNREYGIGIKIKENSGMHNLIKDDLEQREKDEIKRVLYVAMTRAESRLILACQGKPNGFMALIMTYLDPNQCKEISHIELKKESNIFVKNIKEELLEPGNKSVTASVPLLFNVDQVINSPFENYSISQYLTYKDCKRRFYLEYYEKLDIDHLIQRSSNITDSEYFIDPIIKGNIIHKFCELYNSSTDRNELLESLIIEEDIDNIKKAATILNPYIGNYISNYNEDYDESFIEKPFYIWMGDSYIYGIIDRINIKDDLIEIIDIKTNKLLNKESLVKYYEPQIQFYAYAVGKIMNRKVDKAVILFLENGGRVEVNISESILNENNKNIKEFINFVESHDKISDYKQINNCPSYCPYNLLCNIKRD